MYYKKQFVFKEGKPIPAVVRNYNHKDFNALIDVQRESFPPPFPPDLLWNEEQLTNHVGYYPEGAICIEVAGEVVGSITGFLVDFDPEHPEHTWEEVTDNGYIRNHQPDGRTLYIVDISVKPDYRKMDLGKLLMQAMYERVIQDNLDRVLGGGRMPGYHRHAGELDPEQYIQQVIEGKLKDPVITFLLRTGRTPVNLVAGYLDDDESHHYALLMEWKNPFMEERLG
ncbi:MAG TPA: GNAT family N-acetyltransferase [Planococcus sp. (in: firmicutes)]|nr:GNAT family N-acetyltransferase [Planococcus sp. (in: firmicutes)]